MRPILITALMVGIGSMPTTLLYDIDSEMERPFAVTIIGGIVSGKLFTLLLLPML